MDDSPSITIYPKADKSKYVHYKGHVRFNNILDFLSLQIGSSIDVADSAEPNSSVDIQAALEGTMRSWCRLDGGLEAACLSLAYTPPTCRHVAAYY